MFTKASPSSMVAQGPQPEPQPESRTWFTSDLHLNHRNIIRYQDRPFRDVWHMNTVLIERWNARVEEDHLVYVLGDMAMGFRDELPPLIARLKGRKILIKGNHDRSEAAMLAAGFHEVHNELSVEVSGHTLYMRHIPDETGAWEKDHDYHLCGHVHSAWNRMGRIINVGVDVRDFEPKSLQELLVS